MHNRQLQTFGAITDKTSAQVFPYLGVPTSSHRPLRPILWHRTLSLSGKNLSVPETPRCGLAPHFLQLGRGQGVGGVAGPHARIDVAAVPVAKEFFSLGSIQAEALHSLGHLPLQPRHRHTLLGVRGSYSGEVFRQAHLCRRPAPRRARLRPLT